MAPFPTPNLLKFRPNCQISVDETEIPAKISEELSPRHNTTAQKGKIIFKGVNIRKHSWEPHQPRESLAGQEIILSSVQLVIAAVYFSVTGILKLC